jgi:hypothetical protein
VASHTSDLQRSSAPKSGESNVQVIDEQALSHPTALIFVIPVQARNHESQNHHLRPKKSEEKK